MGVQARKSPSRAETTQASTPPSAQPSPKILFFGVAMDSFITLAAPFPGSVTEQPEIPFEQESGSGSGTSTSCTIA
ncbi:hypothetical protein EW026_g1963 [Hermanssonia centrifuga]|uniref:Uncharacterized protein n=1 Tax=Hermanssonia centrifuga TaxID=98765 RepID=A0A4S4KQN6_9APHY|nr:hypothetical protein EW026_g1963 [Hermanssonia centrifuga]